MGTSSSFVAAILKVYPMNITFVQVYAPTGDRGVYETLHGTLDNIPKNDVIVLMGDLNATICKSKVKTKNIGTFGLGTRNKRWDRL